jgi:hypothetical protein
VTRFWIENYFRRPEYYRIADKPVVIIFSPHNLKTDLGGAAGVNQVFAAMREECRQAGLPGLYLAACVGNIHQVDGEDYDAITAYNWPGLGAGGEKQAPFATLVEAYHRQWLQFLEKGRLPLMLPICGGWDSRPWHGDAALARFGRTPELFKQHLRDAKNLLDTHPARTNLLKAILIEAWNEWGEGSYIEPHKEYGFEYLDAIRELFTDAPRSHLHLAPVDVGLGPYDLPPEGTGKTAWTFEQGAGGWDNTMHIGQLRVQNRMLCGLTTGNDPAFFGPPMQARAGEFTTVLVRMRLTADGAVFKDTAQLFWRTKRWPESEASSARFEVAVDSQWHDYSVPVKANRRWAGVVTRLRLDPGARTGVKVEIDRLKLNKE